MKTTLEIPDPVFRRAKAKAAEQGIPLRQFVTEAVQEKLKGSVAEAKPWMKMAGGLRHLHHETARINKLIEDIRRDPFTGIGKPEPLKYHLPGAWSRRIDEEHRLVYIVTDKDIIIIAARYHY